MNGSEIYGWAGQVLRVDLSSGEIAIRDPMRWVPAYLGGRGLAARMAWEEIPSGIGAFHPRNPLIFMAGALVGTPAPTSGRVTVCAVSPQAYPQEWFTRSNVGGHWGAELKYAGYDGLLVTGEAAKPVYLWIEDDQVELRDASSLWGLGIFDTQKQLFSELGDDVRILTIGQAGENLCRIAIIATETESAAGQGGFGAVMGAKKLKAIAVRGHGGVRVADPQELVARSRRLGQALRGDSTGGRRRRRNAARYGQKYSACTQTCPLTSCSPFYRHVPGVVHQDRVYSGQLHCTAPGLRRGGPFGWNIGFEAGFEVAQIANDYGLNHWELRFALGPWISLCQQRGELFRIDGEPIDLNDPRFWVTLLHKITFREGFGDVFAEGAQRTAEILEIGQDIMAQFYPAWGQASHWDGHGSFGSPVFPYWLVTGLQWAMDTRDPMGGGHGYTINFAPLIHAIPLEDTVEWEKVRRLSERVYGAPEAADPRSGYQGKAHAAAFHSDRSSLKDSLGICDNIFPLIVDRQAEDLLFRLDGVEGPSLERYLSEPALGLGLSEEEFYRAGTRIFTLERALQIRHWGRTRATDETIIPYLARPEVSPNPFDGKRRGVDPARFRQLMDEYYDLRGWDRSTGWPTRPSLERLAMKDIAEGLAECSKLPATPGAEGER